jgi:hypothetical protein
LHRKQLAPRRHRFSFLFVLLLCLRSAIPTWAQQGTLPLPDAPVPATRPNTPAAVEKRRWEGIVEPGEKVPPLTTKDKFVFPLHEEIRPLNLVPVVLLGFYGTIRGSDPKYGTDGNGFGERVGAAALRQTSIRIFSDGLLPAVFHEDPRYYRKAYGSTDARIGYALKRLIIDPRDSGKRGFNYSDILGRGMAAALTQTYYPNASVGAGVVFRTWGYSLLGSETVNIFQEFWPDVKHKLLKQPLP